MIRRLQAINPDRRPIVVLHLTSAWPVREWPIERWAELASKVTATIPAIIIQIGTDFAAYNRLFKARRISNAVDWVNKLSLLDLVALMEQANVFVGIDSGPLHIATAIGLRSVALFGPTDARLIIHPRAETTVLTAEMGCIGCHHAVTGPLHWRTGCPNDIACMRAISSDLAAAAVKSALEGPRNDQETSTAERPMKANRWPVGVSGLSLRSRRL
jgi:ADP-heptose:LPS heptosyltransferase